MPILHRSQVLNGAKRRQNSMEMGENRIRDRDGAREYPYYCLCIDPKVCQQVAVTGHRLHLAFLEARCVGRSDARPRPDSQAIRRALQDLGVMAVKLRRWPAANHGIPASLQHCSRRICSFGIMRALDGRMQYRRPTSPQMNGFSRDRLIHSILQVVRR